MGSSTSKAGRTLSKTPSTLPNLIARDVRADAVPRSNPQATSPMPGATQNRPTPEIQEVRNARIEEDGQDPQLLEMLRQVGPVKYPAAAKDIKPQALDPLRSMYAARKRLGEEATAQIENPPSVRTHVEIHEILQILDARKRGATDAEIVAQFKLDGSVLSRLGRGVNTPTRIKENDENGNSKAVWKDRID